MIKRLTKKQIEQIKVSRQEGKTIKELAKKFNVSIQTIKWHTDNDFKQKWRDYRKKYRKKTKPWLKESSKDYQKQYHKNKYKNDEDFRKRQIERSKQYQKLKGGKTKDGRKRN